MGQLSRRSFMVGGVAAALVGGAAITPAIAGKAPVYKTRSGVAIDGTDPVAYFTQGRPVAGSRQYTVNWNGATWRFASAANRDAFRANPARYAPQFGGYCAWAVSQGYTASTTPEAWEIVGGKLYLNFSRGVHRRWSRDKPGHIRAANRNWPSVLN